MTETPPPRRAGHRKTLGFLVGGLILLAAVGVAFFADQGPGSAGTGMAPPVSAVPPPPLANPAEPAVPVGPTPAN